MIGFYAGSFDPFTNGHLAIVKKSSEYFDKIIIGIGRNFEKKRRLDRNMMKNAIEETLKKENIKNAEVVIYDSLTTTEAKKMGADILVRGLRNGTDYEYEENIAVFNEINSGIDTCYLRAGDLGYLSSSLVMDLHVHGKDISQYVPEPVNRIIVEGEVWLLE